MPEYIGPEIESDPTEIEAEMYAYIQSVYPDWVPKEAALATLVSEAISQQVDELLALAASVPTTIFRYFGPLVGVNPNDASTATGSTTWTVQDTAGYTIPAGTSIRILLGSTDFALFATIDETIIAPGMTQAVIAIAAVDEGVASTGLTGTVELLDILDFVTSVTLIGSTSGGFDAESDDEFLDRLTTRLQLLADRPILAVDFAIYAISVEGVARAVALDNYNPANDTFNNEKMVTIFVTNELGQPLSLQAKTDLSNALEAQRELNFVVNVADPAYTTINVVTTVRAYPNYDIADLDTRVTSAILEYLSPANWGTTQFAGSQDTDWVNETNVRILELATVINLVDGVNYVETLTVNGGTADVVMAGRVSLPATNSTALVTVNAA